MTGGASKGKAKNLGYNSISNMVCTIHPSCPEAAAPYKGQLPASSLEVFCDCVRSWCAKVLETLKVTYGHKVDSLRV